MTEAKKVFLIPGWMNGQGMYGQYNNVLSVWQDCVSPEVNIDADYLVGHSLGCNWALYNWKHNKKSRLILVNPLLPKRPIYQWFLRWRRFKMTEKEPEKKKVVANWKNISYGITTCKKLLRENFDDVLSEIPKDKIAVICGENDTFYNDEPARNYIRQKGIDLIVLKGAGHDWQADFDEEIKKKILNTRS